MMNPTNDDLTFIVGSALTRSLENPTIFTVFPAQQLQVPPQQCGDVVLQ